MGEVLRLLLAGPDAPALAEALPVDGDLRMLPPLPGTGGLVTAVARWKPDVVVIDVGTAGAGAAGLVEAVAWAAPYATLIVLAAAVDLETALACLPAGASGLLGKPVPGPELAVLARDLHRRVRTRKQHWVEAHLDLISPRRPQVVAVFSPKGGVGKTTLACNLAVALAAQTTTAVVLIDADLAAGDAALLLDLQPRRSLLDFARSAESPDEAQLDPCLVEHRSGLRLLAAPPAPEDGELIGAAHLKRAIGAARDLADFVVIDTTPAFTDPMLAVLDEADATLLVLTPDIAALKNARTALAVMADLNHPPDRVQVVLNRCSEGVGIGTAQVEAVLGRPIVAQIPDDPLTVSAAAGAGAPFVARRADTEVARAVKALAAHVASVAGTEPGARSPQQTIRSLWQRLFRPQPEPAGK